MRKDDAIRRFWEKKPYLSYLIKHKPGTKKFFSESDKLKNQSEKYSMHLFRIGQLRGKKTLEIGFGTTCWLLRRYASGGAKAYGIDITKAAVDSSKKALKIYGLKAYLAKADASKLPFEDDFFDFAVSLGVIHHTQDPGKCLREIKRVLKPGGEAIISLYYSGIIFSSWFFPITKWLVRLFFNVPGRESMKKAATPMDMLRAIDGDTPVTRMYSEKEARFLFSEFEIIRIEKHMFMMHLMPWFVPRGLHRLLDRMFPLMIYLVVRKKKSRKKQKN